METPIIRHSALDAESRSKFFWIPAVFLVLFLSSQAFADEDEIHKLLSLPEEKIDVGRAALIIAKDIYPDINVNAYSAKIDDLVKGAKIITKDRIDPDYRIRALNTFLYKMIGIRYDFSDPYGKNFKNRVLNGILDSKKGTCASMPVLYLAIAQRLGYPVYAVAAPEHFFLRYVDPNFKEQNIETTGGGGHSSNEEYIKELQISEKGIKSGAYLRTLSRREFLADLVADIAIRWGIQGDIKKAIRYLEHCVKIYPNSVRINYNLGAGYIMYSQSLEGVDAKKYSQIGQFYKERASELGMVILPQEDYIKQLKKKAKEEAKK